MSNNPSPARTRDSSAGICGTGLHIFKGEYEATYPLIPGHEFSGKVTAIGGNVRNFKAGDRVTADPNIPCNRCYHCQRNAPNQCQNLSTISVTQDGAFAEYVLAPEGNVFAIGDLSYPAAALMEHAACAKTECSAGSTKTNLTLTIMPLGQPGSILTSTDVRRPRFCCEPPRPTECGGFLLAPARSALSYQPRDPQT